MPPEMIVVTAVFAIYVLPGVLVFAAMAFLADTLQRIFK